MVIDWMGWGGFGIAIGVALLAELALIGVAALIGLALRRARPALEHDYRTARARLVVLAGVLLAIGAVAAAWPDPDTRGTVLHVLLILAIFAAAWLLSAVVAAAIARVLRRYPVDIADNRDARRVHTQLTVLRRLGVVVIWIVAAGIALFTIPGAEAIGTSVLASAGVASLVAGIAAQSVLGNVFAGVQLAFSGAIRVDDVVIARGEWGRIEEITLTYVILRVWDERRIVLPSSYFTTTPFDNWTRSSTELLGTVHLDVDWRISPAAMRRRLDEILESTPLWDRRVKGLVVEDATGGMVRVRALVSAVNSSDQWDLRCLVREQLVEWVAEQAREALPARRVLMEDIQISAPAAAQSEPEVRA